MLKSWLPGPNLSIQAQIPSFRLKFQSTCSYPSFYVHCLNPSIDHQALWLGFRPQVFDFCLQTQIQALLLEIKPYSQDKDSSLGKGDIVAENMKSQVFGPFEDVVQYSEIDFFLIWGVCTIRLFGYDNKHQLYRQNVHLQHSITQVTPNCLVKLSFKNQVIVT